jgi:hypothetical protein
MLTFIFSFITLRQNWTYQCIYHYLVLRRLVAHMFIVWLCLDGNHCCIYICWACMLAWMLWQCAELCSRYFFLLFLIFLGLLWSLGCSDVCDHLSFSYRSVSNVVLLISEFFSLNYKIQLLLARWHFLMYNGPYLCLESSRPCPNPTWVSFYWHV